MAYSHTAMLSTLLMGIALVTSPQAHAVRILALGDSLTAGYRLPLEKAFPAQLQAVLRLKYGDIEVLNGGLSGDTTAGGLSRLEWALADKPDAVIIELGANDALRGLPTETTRANLDAILERLMRDDTPVLLTGMLAPPNMGPDYANAFNAIFPDLAKKYQIVFYPFFLDGVAANPDLNMADGMHPTAEGVAIIVDNILPSVYKLLNKLN